MGANIEYEFRNLQELTSLMIKLSSFSITEIVYLTLVVLVFSIWTLYLLPVLNFYIEINKKNRELENKKIALKQIIIQKKIEEDIEKEIKAENVKN